MQKNTMAIVLIILGIIVLAFPYLGIVPVAVLSGIAVLFLGLGLIVSGYVDLQVSKVLAILEIVLGIIAFILGIGFIISPSLFSFIAALFIYIAGLFLIIIGIAGILTKVGGSRWNGTVPIIIGLIYLILGSLVSKPETFGILIGLWLLITGVLLFLQKE
ncbi:MAG TPA: DUF308 domain-containing protein [Methanobacteriaceae archaeon]|nr:DUF308 domain-containing protein [Methanobacteriaceae archaeon]